LTDEEADAMFTAVTLTVISGPLCGAEFAYRLPGLCSVGRGQDCSVQVPNDNWHRTISRHHCLLEIDPPEVRVCDLGSLNGTFVNGQTIGRRDCCAEPDTLCVPSMPDHPLYDGDELRVGDLVFRVGVHVGEPGDEGEPCAAACQEV
jgi:pSer/pThr/pTyr-binding forkhead associated (FHA) protein